jgi:Flp pilus assembly protein TadG
VRTKGRERGQTLVEFAIVLPMFMVLLMGVLDFGRVVWTTNTLQAAAREAARFAIVHGGSATTACPVGPADLPTTVVPAASSSCPYPSPSTQAIKDTATAFATGAGGAITVTVCYGAGCSGDTNVSGATDKRGTPVTVVVSTTVNLVTPALLGITSTPLSATTTMLVNH